MLKLRTLVLAAAAAATASALGLTSQGAAHLQTLRPSMQSRSELVNAATIPATASARIPRSAITAVHKSADNSRAPVAHAAAPDNCPLGYVCGYTEGYPNGFCGELQGNNTDLNHSGDCWNNVYSVYNNGAVCNVFLYRGENYSSDGGHEVNLFLHTGLYLKTAAPGLYHHIWSNHWCTQG
jgi:Peptidase inhibitor family I36